MAKTRATAKCKTCGQPKKGHPRSGCTAHPTPAMPPKKRPRARKAVKRAKAQKKEVARLRIPDAEKERLYAAAERERLDFSSWARRVLLREADTVLGNTT